jgi:hypothetical protein
MLTMRRRLWGPLSDVRPIAPPAIRNLQPCLAGTLRYRVFLLRWHPRPITTSPHYTQARKCFDTGSVLIEGGRGKVALEE